VQTK
jgi:hypothetical protein